MCKEKHYIAFDRFHHLFPHIVLFDLQFFLPFFNSFHFILINICQFFFLFAETISISDQVSKGIIFGPLKLTLFIEEVKMYLCFNKRWRLVPSVSTIEIIKLMLFSFYLYFSFKLCVISN